jgi:chromosome transmission fidelity protein 1
MYRVDKGLGPRASMDNEAEPTCTKVYYASRTHSQLSQIIPELRRVKLSHMTPPLMNPASSLNSRKRDVDEMEAPGEPHAYTRTVALGSRKQLCINDDLRARSRDLDEGCRELLGGKVFFLLPLLGRLTILDQRKRRRDVHICHRLMKRLA